MRGRLAAAALAVAIAAAPVYSAETAAGLPDGVDAATGFRMERYRSPVPHLLPGGAVVDAAGAKAALGDGRTVFVDVYPVRGAGMVRPDGSWIVAEPRLAIPGAVWLPNVGLGPIDAATEDWFRAQLAGLTAGDPARPLLFYCASDCWHSWNAARRAILWGYTAVSWYPDGSEGWAEAGGTLVEAVPVRFAAPDGP